MTIYNKKIVAPDLTVETTFFDAEPVTAETEEGVYVTFFDNRSSADALATFLGGDLGAPHLVAIEDYRNERAFNGMGFGGTFVRFRAEKHTLAEIRSFMATLP